MYNWSVDEEKFKKEAPKEYQLWKLEQMINYGLGEEKLDAKLLKKHWKKLFMDELTKRYLTFLLWPPRAKSWPRSRKSF